MAAFRFHVDSARSGYCQVAGRAGPGPVAADPLTERPADSLARFGRARLRASLRARCPRLLPRILVCEFERFSQPRAGRRSPTRDFATSQCTALAELLSRRLPPSIVHHT